MTGVAKCSGRSRQTKCSKFEFWNWTMTGYDVRFLLLMVTIYVSMDTASSGCPYYYLTCPCGQDGTIEVPIKRYLSMNEWGSTCKYFRGYRPSRICNTFKYCARCQANPNGGCIECKAGLFGKFCNNECKCLHDGECDDKTGSCVCKDGFTGNICENKTIIDCGGPTLPYYGSVLAKGTTEGFIATYSCSPNFHLIGPKTRTCLFSGQWSGRTPVCVYSCPVPIATSHLKVEVEHISYLTDDYISSIELVRSARFECITGYELVGPEIIHCLSDSNWNAQQPKCVHACQKPTPIQDGEMSMNVSKFLQGDEIIFRCHRNFRLEGSNSITCIDGKWNLPIPRCETEVQCPELLLDNGRVYYSANDRIPGSEAEIHCYEGYEPTGFKAIICSENGDWSSDENVCVEEEEEDGTEYPDPEAPENGWVNTDSSFSISYGCQKGMYVSGAKDNYFVNGTWKYDTPSCIKVTTCLELTSPKRCDMCYGKDCASSGVPSDNCFVPTNGVVLPRGLLPVGTVVEFRHARQFYRLYGSVRRTCQDDGYWSGRQPVCEPKCGISANNKQQVTPRIKNGKPSRRGEWPWYAGIFRKTKDGVKLRCGGSLISDYLILTVAHCVVNKESGNKFKVSEIEVRLGQVDLREYDDLIIVSQVSSIIVHQNYNSETLYNDVAIIHLKDGFMLTNSVRPVCLPTKTSDYQGNQSKMVQPESLMISNMTGVQGVVIGWGVTENGFQSNVLNMVNITIVDQEACKQSYKNHNITVTDNMLCAGSNALGQPAACQGDSGGPLVVKGDDEIWSVVGIVSWGTPCTRKTNQNYGVYTRVEKFITWINKQS